MCVRRKNDAMPATASREMTINLRATQAQKSIIRRAADAAGETYTAFMLGASMERAEAVLADRLHFALSDAQMSRFLEALEAPMPDDAALRELLARTPQWLR